jgi:DNA uptake protein ComE-like DNA-binding protein
MQSRFLAVMLVALPLAAQQPKPATVPKVAAPAAAKAAEAAKPAAAAAAAAPAAAAAVASAALPTAQNPLDINSATKAQLEGLPGVGPAFADRILKGRPFQRKDQLKGILPAGVYEKIQAIIIAKQLTK